MTVRRFPNPTGPVFCFPALLFLVAACLNAFAADVVYIDKPSGQSYTRQQVETAAKFYGLDTNVTVLTGSRDSAAAVKAIHNTDTLAVVITADALPALDHEQVVNAIQKQGHRISLLIAGITEQTDPALIRQWSAGAITNCRKSAIGQGSGSYAVASVKNVTGQLSGSKMPLSPKEVSYLKLESGRGAQWLIAATSASVKLPVFANATVSGQQVFFATIFQDVNIPVTPDPYRQVAVFSTLAPQMMFLRYAAGERVWRSPGRYANLTIDDPWLREPYGYVNYDGLLREMEQHNFHTTLGFVAWNFDRSHPAVVSLFRTHGDRFSICMHGNNHDHREFASFDGKPFEGQIKDIKQGLARMGRFTELTQLSYDPVMVFPHAISPEGTLAALKRYNFAATVNFINVPLGATTPSDPEFALRPATMAFSNFPSLRRYSAEAPIPESQLAIDAFLGSPMLFYVHQGFFASGIAAFNKTADAVNQLQPDTQWRSLGYITQHLYLEKLRHDGNYDIRAYGGTIHLDNGHKRDVKFYVKKEETFDLPVTVLVDGKPYPYQREGFQLRLQLPVRDGMSRQITIKYENDLNLAGIDISKTSLRVTAIRHLSDFRDDVVSKVGLGRRFIRSYSENGSTWDRIIGISMLAAAVTVWYLRTSKNQTPPSQTRGLRNPT